MRWIGAELDWLIILVFGGVAVACAVAPPLMRWRFERFAKGAVWATARVLDTESETNRYGKNSVTTYYADVEFRTEEGDRVAIRLEVDKDVDVGAEIPVVYHAGDPHAARLDWSSTPDSQVGWSGVGAGLLFAGIGFAMLWGIGAIEVG